MRKCFYVLVGMAALLSFLSGCQNTSKNVAGNAWNPPIEGLTWGMSSDEVKQLYSFKNEANKKDGTFWVELNEKIPIYDIDMEVTLSFYESEDIMLGLQSITLSCPEEYAGEFKNKLEKRFEGISGSTSDENGWISWVTKASVSDYYSSEQLWDAFSRRLGDDYMIAHSDYLTGYIDMLPRSPLALFKLKYEGESSGSAIISGTSIAVLNYLFD